MNNRVNLSELIGFVQGFMPPDEAERLFYQAYSDINKVMRRDDVVSDFDKSLAEQLICQSVGNLESSSVGSLVTAFVEQGALDIRHVMRIVEGAKQFFEFMQDLVQSSIEHISQGISVVDQQMRMVAWNRRYLEFFEYPEGYVKPGRPVADLIRFNLERSGISPDDIDSEVNKRVNYLKEGSPHHFERYQSIGRVLEVSGNPMPGGGFVTSYTDITSHKELESELRHANETLEMRVQQRTQELEVAKLEAEQANFSKTQFLAAASHDLMQPLNAASLFASALAQKTQDTTLKSLSENVVLSLHAADALINSMLEASRLDSGAIQPKVEVFAIEDLLATLDTEFTVLAHDRNLDFHKISSTHIVRSDPHLLRRILQNFLSNAVRYTRKGRIVLGCRIQGDDICRIEVWDTGPGIPENKYREVFEEFRRIKGPAYDHAEKGLGLGLAIADRMARLLQHQVRLRSWVGKGSVFSVDVPRAKKQDLAIFLATPIASPAVDFHGVRILCIDNEKTVLEGMRALLSGWSCEVQIATDEAQALACIQNSGLPDAILADYQLDDGVTGIQLLQKLSASIKHDFPGIIVTANNTEDIRRKTENSGYLFMAKPVKPAKLRALLSSLLKR